MESKRSRRPSGKATKADQKPKKQRRRAVWSDGTRVEWEDGKVTTIQPPRSKPRRYLNCDVPDRLEDQPLASAICAERGRCGHGYTDLLGTGRTVCPECQLQALAAKAAYLQAAGIPLGWPSRRDPTDERRAYGFAESVSLESYGGQV